MNDQNLPVSKETFVDRLKKAWGILTNNNSYQSQVEKTAEMQEELKTLRERENDITQGEVSLRQKQSELEKRFAELALKEADFNERFTALKEKEAKLASQMRHSQGIADLYKEGQNMPEETPDFKVNTEKFISGKLQDLQGDIKTLQDALQQNIEMSPEEKRRISVQSNMLKAKFLATLMVYSETLNKNEMSACQIGDKKVTLNVLLNSLPRMFGWEKPIEQTKNNSRELDMENPEFTKYALIEEYSNLLDNLLHLGILQGEPNNCVDYKYGKSGTTSNEFLHYLNEYCKFAFELPYDSHRSDEFSRLLHKYCGMPLSISYRDPLRNFKMLRTPNPNVVTISTSPTTDEVSKTVESFGISQTDKNEDAR